MKTLIAVIAYNEEKNIKGVIEDLRKHNCGYDIVLIDNGSFDNTVKICKDMGVKVISHCVNTGNSSGTLMTYFLYAFMKDYDILCQFDGDGQAIASELPKIIDPIKNDDADYILGSRFLKKEGFQSSFLRRIGIKLFSYLASIIIKQKITDITCGFRAYNKKVIRYFAQYHKHEIIDTTQLILISYFSGARIKEVPFMARERKHGKSEFDFFTSLLFPIKGLISVTGTWLQRNRIKVSGG